MTLLDYFIIHKRKLHCNSFMLIFLGFRMSFPPKFLTLSLRFPIVLMLILGLLRVGDANWGWKSKSGARLHLVLFLFMCYFLDKRTFKIG